MDVNEKLFKKGGIYQSKSHGEVQYEGIDLYMSQSTYKFYSLTYSEYCYWLPESLHWHFNKNDMPSVCGQKLKGIERA